MLKSDLVKRLEALEVRINPFKPIPIVAPIANPDEQAKLIEKYQQGKIKVLPLFIKDCS